MINDLNQLIEHLQKKSMDEINFDYVIKKLIELRRRIHELEIEHSKLSLYLLNIDTINKPKEVKGEIPFYSNHLIEKKT